MANSITPPVTNDPSTPRSTPRRTPTITASPKYAVEKTSSGVHATTATSDQQANASGLRLQIPTARYIGRRLPGMKRLTMTAVAR